MHNEHRMKSKACGQSQTIRSEIEMKKTRRKIWCFGERKNPQFNLNMESDTSVYCLKLLCKTE